MLTEVAFTPQLFGPSCQADGTDWRECLRELAAGLFPRTAPCPIVTSNLSDGQWLEEARRLLGTIPAGDAMYCAQGLLSKLKETLVLRPSATGRWLADETEPAWVDEILAADEIEALGRAVVSADRFCRAAAPNGSILAALGEVRESGFWETVSADGTLPLNVEAQASALRPVLLHADYLALKLPHIRGEENDDTPLAAALIQSAVTRPEGFAHPTIELHVDNERYDPQMQLNALHGELDGRVPAGTNVLLCMRDRFIERLLFAGSLDTSRGEAVPHWRWAVSMGHTARRRDSGNELTTWSLLGPRDIARRLPEIDKEDLLQRNRCLSITF